MKRATTLHHAARRIRGTLVALCLIAVPALGSVHGASAQPARGPVGITPGPDGNIWFTEYRGNSIGRITPTGRVTTFRLPAPVRRPEMITSGPDGNIWFTETAVNRIGRITPFGKLTEYRVPTDEDPTMTRPGAFLGGIAAGPDGNIWFTEGVDNRICRMTLSGKVSIFRLPTSPGVAANAIHNAGMVVAGPPGSGALWFTDNQAGNIGRITTAGKVQEFEVRTGSTSLNGLAAGPDGNLYVSDGNADVIDMITPAGLHGRLDFPASDPYGLAAGPNGTMWFAAPGDNAVGRIMIAAGSSNEYTLPANNSNPLYITVGADGNFWFTEYGTDTIGRITPQGVVKEFAL